MQNAPREHSAILWTFIKLPFVFKTFVLPIFEWPLKTGFTVYLFSSVKQAMNMYWSEHIFNGSGSLHECLQIKSLKTKVTHNTKAIDGKDEELRQLQSCLDEKGSENESLEEQLQELNKVVEEEKARAKEAVKKVIVESEFINI